MRLIVWACALVLPFSASANLLVPEVLSDAHTEASGPRRCRDCSRARTLERKVDDVRDATYSTSRCNLNAVAANARRIGAGTSSRGLCLPSVRRAFERAGCGVPAGFAHNAVYAFNHLRGVWHCRAGGTAAGAPDNAVLFSVGCGSHHTEFKSGNCYYSDFHHPDCLASSEYTGCPYRQIGWCHP